MPMNRATLSHAKSPIARSEITTADRQTDTRRRHTALAWRRAVKTGGERREGKCPFPVAETASCSMQWQSGDRSRDSTT